MIKPVIQAKNMGVVFNAGKENTSYGLKEISFQIYPQEYIIIFGPSGCGKSTLLYALSGLLTPSYGEIWVDDKNIANLNAREKADFRMTHIGMVFQSFCLIPTLSVLDNTCLPLIFKGESAKKRRHEAMQILQRFKISEQADKYPGQLSGGQQQRVAISRALINDPSIVFVDEPVGNLDSVSAENVMQYLNDLNTIDKKTIILVTHDSAHLRYADRIFKMSDGRIVEEVVRNQKYFEEASFKHENMLEVDRSKVKELEELEKTSKELRVLMRTFQGISEAQGNILMTPFKAKQILNYLTNRFSDRKREVGERYVREFLGGSIDSEELFRKLDLPYKEGGGGWNRKSAETIARRLDAMMRCAKAFSKGEDFGIDFLREYLMKRFSLDFTEKEKRRLTNILRMRVAEHLEREQLYRWLDLDFEKGGLSLRSTLAERLAEEIELIMLLKYA